jgi:mevalonate kinase
VENQRSYPAKLLLFGEHVLLLGAPALAVPLQAFGGQWAWSQTADRHHERLLEFARSEALQAVESLDVTAFVRDLHAGLFFQSNIPTGYGLGSSGALCAAVYDRYTRKKKDDLTVLKTTFAGMESFFHGNSSGIDPLTSYLAAPVLVASSQQLQTVPPPAWPSAPPLVFLLDTRLPRRTGPLVEWFLQHSRTASFGAMLENEYLPTHRRMLQAWLSADTDNYWPALQQISSLQFEYFTPMIPDTLRDLWQSSLRSDAFTLKICGAGGGGYMLGFARTPEAVEELKKRYPLVLPMAEG